MRLVIDTDAKTLSIDENNEIQTLDLYSKEAFERISQQWVRVGWDQKYPYTFSWMGRPIIQLPEDMLRIQEVIYQLKPDLIIETGVAHGGSLIFYSSLCKAIGSGRVVGIDVEIRPHNRQAIESHELFDFITLIEGCSVSDEVVSQVKKLIQPHDKVLVILDSNHTYEHVSKELECYSEFVTPESYIVATDGVMADLVDVPRGQSDWKLNNPECAAIAFAKRHPEFTIEQPFWPFNESQLDQNITHWPSAWLRRVSK